MQTLPLRHPLLEVFLHRGAVVWRQKGPAIAGLGLLIAIAWNLAQLTWILTPRPSLPQSGPSPVSAAQTQFDPNRLAEQHLFGIANPSAPTDTNAPETTLALTLHGIVAGHSADTSRALIVANGDERPYAPGATLPGGAVIRGIYPDRVLLERDGQLETLRLPKANDGNGGDDSSPTQDDTGPTAPAQPANLAELRQQVVSNPQRLMDVVRAMPVMDKKSNRLTGYRVYPAGNPNLFNQLGLRPGDVVTGVNGIPLTDPAQSMRILSTLKTSDQISITLLRNGQEQNQVLQLQDQSSDDGD